MNLVKPEGELASLITADMMQKYPTVAWETVDISLDRLNKFFYTKCQVVGEVSGFDPDVKTLALRFINLDGTVEMKVKAVSIYLYHLHKYINNRPIVIYSPIEYRDVTTSSFRITCRLKLC